MIIFHVVGEEFAVDHYLQGSEFTPYSVFHKGDTVGQMGRKLSTSGFRIQIDSDRNHSLEQVGQVEMAVDFINAQFLEQVDLAAEFVSAHEAELIRLSKMESVERMVLDFGVVISSAIATTEFRLPSSLLLQLGKLRIDADISIYLQEVEADS